MTETAIPINEDLSIPSSEVSFRVSRSGGPGGQHVNTSSTRVELVWNLESSSSLTDQQRALLRDRLSGRISADGTLAMASSATRSQQRNKDDAIERFAELLRKSLRMDKPRRKTKPPRAAHEKRLAAKKRRSETKKARRNPADE